MARTNRTAGKAAPSPLAPRRKIDSSRPLIEPSSSLLEMHLQEIGEECRNIAAYLRTLRRSARTSKAAQAAEADLYAALTHLEHHAGPAVKEWERVMDGAASPLRQRARSRGRREAA